MSQKNQPYPASNAWMLDNWIRRMLQPPSQLIEKLNISPSDVFVDFGCGPGYYTKEIAKRAKTLIDIDRSTEMLQKAQNKAAKAKLDNVEFMQSDGTRIDLADASADKILLVLVYHELSDKQAVLAELRRILKAEGKLMIVEIIKKGLLPAPVQNQKALTSEVEFTGFKIQQLVPYKLFGIFFFTKT